jgi:hypothetical protein
MLRENDKEAKSIVAKQPQKSSCGWKNWSKRQNWRSTAAARA